MRRTDAVLSEEAAAQPAGGLEVSLAESNLRLCTFQSAQGDAKQRQTGGGGREEGRARIRQRAKARRGCGWVGPQSVYLSRTRGCTVGFTKISQMLRRKSR